jgi:hypothetical protein
MAVVGGEGAVLLESCIRVVWKVNSDHFEVGYVCYVTHESSGGLWGVMMARMLLVVSDTFVMFHELITRGC